MSINAESATARTILLPETPMAHSSPSFQSVYGPVQSWRFGRSLGIDPIGAVSSCSLDCVYCQLGEIELKTSDRQIFVPTVDIRRDLLSYAPWDVDWVTLSGSGEPTLALNLGDILAMVAEVTHRPKAVLTNGTLLHVPQVRAELAIADAVAVKLDAITPDMWRRIGRPVDSLEWSTQWTGVQNFRREYSGRFLVQTMLLSPWSEADQDQYIAQMRELHPDEIQLNTPTRPKPLNHQLDARGNHALGEREYPVRSLKPVTGQVLETFRDRLQSATCIPVRIPDLAALTPSS